MKILGRDIELSRLPAVAKLLFLGAMRAFRLFRRPVFLLGSYLRRRTPPGTVLELHDGGTLVLSSYPGDVVTVFVVFCKQEYGTDFAGKTVLDVGGNIGAFALLACRHGCRRLVSVEPSPEAFSVLEKNLAANGFGDRAAAIQSAVCGSGEGSVSFPATSSPLNSLYETPTATATVEVPAVSLGALLEAHFPQGLDLLKLDCEGAEVEIIAHAGPAVLGKIHEIRMEFHHADIEPTLELLHAAGFFTVLYERLGPLAHTLWVRSKVSG